MMMFSVATKSTKVSLMKHTLERGLSASSKTSLATRSYCSMAVRMDLAAMQHRNIGLMAIQQRSVFANTPIRGFFGRKKGDDKDPEQPKKEAPGAENAKVDEAAADANTQKGSAKIETKKEDSKSTESTTTSEEEKEEEALSGKDVKRIK